MTLEQLRIFIAVAERQHMTQAAAALNMAQSAASSAIAALESRHGVRFFSRIGRRIELTESGRLFLTEARAVLARSEAAELLLSELGGLTRGKLSIFASQTIASYWLPRHLVAFRRAHPNIELSLTTGNSAEVVNAIRDGLAQLGLIEGMTDDPALKVIELARDQMVVVVGPEHPWVRLTEITPGQLVESEWVLREVGSGTRSIFESALAGFGITSTSLTVQLQLSSNEAVRAAVEAGMGATAISASVVASSLEAGLLHKISINLPDRPFSAIQHMDRHPGAAADALLAMMTRKKAGVLNSTRG